MSEFSLHEADDGFEPDGMRIQLKIKKHLCSEKSRFQQIDFYQTEDHGILFTLDGVFMVTDRDEFIYHEMMSHVPLFVHPKPAKILIIRGGDGGVLREVLKHPQVEQADLCEIDEKVVELSQRFFPYLELVLKDLRAHVFYEDGFDFLNKRKEQYDVVIVDSTDPNENNSSLSLVKEDFFKLLTSSLNKDGIFVMQSLSP